MREGFRRQAGNRVRLYALQDAQQNTTCTLIQENGSYVVKERYVYDPHGLAMVLKPDWSRKMTSGAVWRSFRSPWLQCPP